MGNLSSKAVTVTNHAKNVVNALQNTASAAATTTRRKIQKEGQQFMASERAEKVLEKQKHVPKRAPMNLGTAAISEDVRSRRMKEVEEQQQQDHSYLSLMKDVYVSSQDQEESAVKSPDEHSGKRSEDLKSKLPQKKITPLSDTKELAPRGRAEIKTVIDALYNHKMNPQDWGPAEVAEKIRVRESDAKDILENFELLEGTSIFKSSDQQKLKIT